MTSSTPLPQQYEMLCEFAWDQLNHSGLTSPTFLWDASFHRDAEADDEIRMDVPIASPEEAQQIIDGPITWYLRMMDSLSPTQKANGPSGIPLSDMPTFFIDSGALAGVEAVISNARSTTRWHDAAVNFSLALLKTSAFLGSIADREGEGLTYLKRVIDETRTYFDSVANHADPVTGGLALNEIINAACKDDFRFNPIQMVTLISCALPFAQWDDTRVFVYDAMDRARATMDSIEKDIQANDRDDPAGNLMMDSDGNLIDVSAGSIREQFNTSMLLLRHDVLRLYGDDEQADRLLRDNSDLEPFADTRAIQLIAGKRWRELYDFASRILDDDPYQQITLIPPNLVPDDWHTILDLAQYELAHGQ